MYQKYRETNNFVWYLKIVLSYCALITESPLLEVSPLVSPHIIFELQIQGALSERFIQ